MISIIITIYNSEMYLKQCLDSMLAQTYKDYEVIMVNDGSTDSSRAIALSYTSDSRFKFVNSPHIGFPQAKNLGLSKVKGDYIIFLDSDDVVHPQWLELLLKPMVENDADITYCSYIKFEHPEELDLTLLDNSAVCITDMSYQKMCPLFYDGCRNYLWNKLIKKEFYDNVVFQDCPGMSDVRVIYKIFDKAEKVFQVKASLINYRQHPGSITSQLYLSDWFVKYRFELILEVLTFIFNKYEISKFICRRTLENELFKVRSLTSENEYINIYNEHKKDIEAILVDSYECNFDVDLVVPFVDNRDPVWQKAYTDLTHRNDYLNNSRFDNPDLFEYFLRGVDKFMPWVRTIHLIVSNIEQVPSYINKDKTHIVLHKDIIPEQYLPTFNSSTIEMFIPNIKGLSEHFVYANDDMYPIAPMKKSDFFSAEGKPKIVFKTNYVEKDMTFFNELCLNVHNHTSEALGVPFDNKTFLRPEHTIAAFRLSDCKNCVKKMWKYIEKDLGPFRTTKQHTQYMYALYERFTNNYVFGGPSLSFHALNGNQFNITKELKYRAAPVMCLNGVSENLLEKESLDKIVQLLKENLEK